MDAHLVHHAEIETAHLAVGFVEIIQIPSAGYTSPGTAEHHHWKLCRIMMSGEHAGAKEKDRVVQGRPFAFLDRVQLGRDEQEADLIYSFAELAHPYRSLISFEWVKGHQDKSAEGLAARLNQKADRLATHALSKATPCTDIVPSPASVAIPFLNNRPILSKLSWNVRLEYNATNMIERLCSRNQWSRPFFDLLFWEGLEKSLGSLQTGLRFTITKFCNDLLPTVNILLRRREKEPSRCFSCNSCDVKTPQHLFLCKGHAA